MRSVQVLYLYLVRETTLRNDSTPSSLEPLNARLTRILTTGFHYIYTPTRLCLIQLKPGCSPRPEIHTLLQKDLTGLPHSFLRKPELIPLWVVKTEDFISLITVSLILSKGP